MVDRPVASAANGKSVANDDPATATADRFFGATNLYTFHLTIAPDQWAIMEQLDSVKPNAFPPGRLNRPPGIRPGPMFGRGGNGPGPGRGGNGPMMGLEFKKGTASLQFQGRSFGPVRVRFKGNSSFRFAAHSLKRSLKLDFSEPQKGLTFYGLTKLNLNNNAMDPAQLREALAYDVFRHAGVPAGRTAFAEVFLTVPGRYERAYAGLFTVVEQVDERFLKDRFGVKGGLLLKPEGLPGLPYLGDDWSAYTNQVQSKMSVSAGDARRFMEFARFLNSAEDNRFQAGVGDYIDVDEHLRFLALEGVLANLDSPLMTGHNYYLYLHPQTRKLSWIPWDLNEAFGGFGPAGSPGEQIELSVDHPYTRVNRLAARLLETPVFKERYHQILGGLLATNFNAARLFPWIDAMTATIRSSLAKDPMVTLPQFEAALSGTNANATAMADFNQQPGFFPGGRAGQGGPSRARAPLKLFINQRVASIHRQLEGKDNGYVPREIRPGPGGPMPAGPPLDAPR
jgi:spore coat protein H